MACCLAILAVVAGAASAAAQDDDLTRSRERGADQPTSQVRYVFAGIAIDQYAESVWPTLSNAQNDLEAVQEVLSDHFGFFTTPDLIILNEEADESGIKRLVRGTLRDVLRPEDRLVLFYAGHGAVSTDTLANREVRHTGHLVPADAGGEDWSWIRVNDFLGWVDNLPAEQVLVILDACHSGFAIPDGLKEWEDAQVLPVEDLESRPARRVLVSAKAFQTASDGGVDFPDNSLFTGWLTEGLRLEAQRVGDEEGPDRDHDDVVSTWELFHFLRDRLDNTKQTPVFGAFSQFDTGGQIVFPIGVDPAQTAFDRAISALGGDLDAFIKAAEDALGLLDADDPRAAYLQWRLAEEQFDRPGARDALLRLRGYAQAGQSIAPLSTGLLNRRLEMLCSQIGGCEGISEKADD